MYIMKDVNARAVPMNTALPAASHFFRSSGVDVVLRKDVFGFSSL